MQETLTIFRRRERDQFDDFVAFKGSPADYFWTSSDMSGLAQMTAWHAGKSGKSNKDYSYQLLFPQDISGVVIPEKLKIPNSTFHVLTDEEKNSFMKMFDIHRTYFLEHIAIS